MKIEARYAPTIMSGAVIRFGLGYDRGIHRDIISGEERTDWSGEINASREGVSIAGQFPVYGSPADMAALCGVLQSAWMAHLAIKMANDDHDTAKIFVQSFNSARERSAA